MGRAKRADAAGAIYHMLNRANWRTELFEKMADYEAFERILVDAVTRFEIDLFSYCVMPNHWHMVVRPRQDGEMSRFAQRLQLTHTQRYHAHHHSAGRGHLYQGRYKSFPVQDDEHFLTVNRYVERNAFSAELCQSPEDWRFGSLWRWNSGTTTERSLLTPWPIARRPDWIGWVRRTLSDRELERLRWCVQRGSPFGGEAWVESIARRYDLESTLRPRGRPKKTPPPE
ncbi:Transposase IS200 like protein [Rubripirellula tenax]|uniref:Transposase IS200 like protein n=1 Tax=Rubripirellula tenax TaxID=2528015 RepID=A0A5C6EMY7_9BACT|nr:transposase [Rubripirellula tenax]TWU48926.1 Transposase IS200 like protein [Rubripirellula tenax]